MLSRLQVGTSPGSCSDGTTEYGSTGSALVSPDSTVSSDGAGPSGAGAEALGASLFSVPPREAPSTGIYALPEAAFKIRDLDSGAEYALDKRFWIKDRDTGAVYVLESGAERGGEAGQGPNGASPGSPSPLDATAGQRAWDEEPAPGRRGWGTVPAVRVGPGVRAPAPPPPLLSPRSPRGAQAPSRLLMYFQALWRGW
ncbi:hypothetical protein APUTEX25_002096 [Auxenochlorella protothecoides]|uniref:Uncharacterized protein n=1 Tax=Auxenochlorella protothecoides TaxID=3075 RepID=A0A3M7KXK6_AUXPR|nr:hypothetical protein APUTEX25_002096 [Auxenochlorella protothecoides]|eukprot:RMZ54520.1 hypothetical protein APUTEX25_002096 [Auxenochlorella protothecoides]